MRLLLDTHIWIWTLNDPEKLGHRTRQELRSADNELWVSPISTWEALMLRAKGRLDLPEDLAAWMSSATAPFLEAPLTHEIALASRRLSFAHQDPADRFLAATAQILDLTLVTADIRLLGLGEIATLANR